MKKERVFRIFIFAVSILHIFSGMFLLVISINKPDVGLIRLLSLYFILIGITILMLNEISTKYHKMLHQLKETSQNTIDFLVEELEKKEEK